MLRVSDNHRFLVRGDGRPFFYLGDTCWELFHRLTREEANEYLADRAAKGFTVIQAVILWELGELTDPNAHGESPFVGNDISRPNERFFAQVDSVVEKAASLGLTMGLLPSWGDKVGVNYWGRGPAHFINEENARGYGEFLGRRYRERPVIWIFGGDRPGDCNEEIWRRMAAGLKAGGSRHLITYHPCGPMQSSTWFHNEDWLDFNMVQTGHKRFTPDYNVIAGDYSRTPPKPCMNGEPPYEDICSGFIAENGYLEAYDCRLSAWWCVLAGAHGHTYGCNSVWQCFDPAKGHKPLFDVRRSWREGMALPGATQMGHLRRVIESRPFLTRIPDQSLIREGQKFGAAHVRVSRDGAKGRSDATYVMAYFPRWVEVVLDAGRIGSTQVRGWWFNPRTGEADAIGTMANPGHWRVAPPTNYSQQDWLLVLDDAARDYPPPGGRSMSAG